MTHVDAVRIRFGLTDLAARRVADAHELSRRQPSLSRLRVWQLSPGPSRRTRRAVAVERTSTAGIRELRLSVVPALADRTAIARTPGARSFTSVT